MKIAILVIIASAATISAAFAQDQPPVTLRLTSQQLNVVGQALQELPWRLANPILAEIQRQIAEQQKPPADPAEPRPQ